MGPYGPAPSGNVIPEPVRNRVKARNLVKTNSVELLGTLALHYCLEGGLKRFFVIQE